ncbi:MAG: beta-barrel assembly machine subunit BamB [Gammaproteobacteria bacterium]|jgi:outer membrane protein assembly factor BamB|nr:beta-barrel assembly machine subunit BamB [Gammaproteobacteria bacterium]
MKKSIHRLLCVSVLAALLVGCEKDNTPPPTPLAKAAPNLVQVQNSWSRSTGDGSDEQYLSFAPAIDQGVVYTVDYAGRVEAVSVNGNKLWSMSLDMPISSAPAAANGLVVFGTMDGHLVALNSSNGKKLWTATLTSSLLSAPAIGNNVIIVHTHDGDVSAFNAQNGKQLWMYSGSTPDLMLEASTKPVIAGNLVVVGFANGQLAAFNLQTGVLQWLRPIAMPSGANAIESMVDVGTPVISNGIIYDDAYHGSVVAVNLTDGSMVWQHALSAYQPIALVNGKIIVTSETGRVWALDQKTGQQIWVQDSLQYRFVTGPAVVGNLVAVGDYQGYIHWLSLDNGQLMARTKVDSTAIQAQPVVLNNQLFVTSSGGELAVLQPASK